MISERKSELTNVIHDLEVVLKSTKEKDQSQRLQKAINTLKQHSVTVRVKGTAITLFTDDVEEVEIESKTAYDVIPPQAVNPAAVALSSKPSDENGVKFIDTKVVADYYGVTTETVRNWIKYGKISGKQLSYNGKWFIPAEEFEYLKQQRENDDSEDDMKDLLGEDFGEDWDVELDEKE